MLKGNWSAYLVKNEDTNSVLHIQSSSNFTLIKLILKKRN